MHTGLDGLPRVPDVRARGGRIGARDADLIREIALVQRDAGVEDQRISYRMTGCPNGCTRPYLGDVGFVGTTLGKYDVFVGGDFEGTRLSEPYMHNVKLEEIPRVLRGPLFEYASTRLPGEGFGDWCTRNGVRRSQHVMRSWR